MPKWQNFWNNTTKASCTRKLIPDVRKYLTQMITAHGGFKTYLKKFKLKETGESKKYDIPMYEIGGSKIEDSKKSSPQEHGADHDGKLNKNGEEIHEMTREKQVSILPTK